MSLDPSLARPASSRHIQAWREVNELPDRELMRDGRWLVDASAPRGGGPEAPRAEAKDNQTYCPKLVRSSQPTPTETAKTAPPKQMETR